jgi:hypothetical protein
METVLSGLSLLLMFAVVGLLIVLSGRYSRARRRGRTGAGGPARAGTYTPMGYAFSWTIGAALFTISGLLGIRLGRHERFVAGTRSADGIIYWQVLMGLAMACVAIYFWRRGLRDIRSNVRVPELAGHDAAAPPSRRIERR